MAISLGPSGLNINGTIVDGPEDLGSPTTFGSVGTYGFFVRRVQGITSPGNTLAGSNLRYWTYQANSSSTVGQMYRDNPESSTARFFIAYNNNYEGTPSGTWRVMGLTSGSSTTHTGSDVTTNHHISASLFVRTA